MVKDKLKTVYDCLLKDGNLIEDTRFNRKVKSIYGYTVNVLSEELNELKDVKPLEKYDEDWSRMYRGFKYCCNEVKENRSSRRMVIHNTSQYEKIFECFQLIQFVLTENDEYLAIVYQRSADLKKWLDDLTFFANVCKRFEKRAKVKVSNMIIHYGDLHTEIKQ